MKEATLVWHIDRAKFIFNDLSDYSEWKLSPKVFFEFSPSMSDDKGSSVFSEASILDVEFEITPEKGTISISIEDDGPVITAWVKVEAVVQSQLDENILATWSSEDGGWASCTISLGNHDAYIREDDGGEWRML